MKNKEIEQESSKMVFLFIKGNNRRVTLIYDKDGDSFHIKTRTLQPNRNITEVSAIYGAETFGILAAAMSFFTSDKDVKRRIARTESKKKPVATTNINQLTPNPLTK